MVVYTVLFTPSCARINELALRLFMEFHYARRRPIAKLVTSYLDHRIILSGQRSDGVRCLRRTPEKLNSEGQPCCLRAGGNVWCRSCSRWPGALCGGRHRHWINDRLCLTSCRLDRSQGHDEGLGWIRWAPLSDRRGPVHLRSGLFGSHPDGYRGFCEDKEI